MGDLGSGVSDVLEKCMELAISPRWPCSIYHNEYFLGLSCVEARCLSTTVSPGGG